MPAKKKIPAQAEQKKVKLRTASDVLSRLKWSEDEDLNAQNTIMGYDCRIHGPMEKCVDDYAGINEGGDIPEHRIQYFRRAGSKGYEKLVFWDREGRVDRLFGSGGNPNDPISPITVQNVAKAVATMKRIAEEKAIRAQEKAKRRARAQAKKSFALRVLPTNNNNNTSSAATESTEQRYMEESSSSSSQRHVWHELDRVFVYDVSKNSWVPQRSNGFKSQEPSSNQEAPSSNKLKFITWNVLFDLHRNEKDEWVQGDDTLLSDQDSTVSRWQNLLNVLEDEQADVISLQEVTPRFVQQLEQCQWTKDHYVLSAVSTDLCGVESHGNFILWKVDSFEGCKGLHMCIDQGRDRVILASLLMRNNDNNNTVLNVANVHLPADQRDNKTGERRDRTQARKREFGAIMSKLQVLEQSQRKENLYPVPFVIGDFNAGDDEPAVFQSEHLVDAWFHPSNKAQGEHCCTFDWKRNQRANKTRQHGHQQKAPRRIDRIVLGTQDAIVPCESNLIGDSSDDGLPPSDHFGVSVTFQTKAPNAKMEPILYTQSKVEHNVWATTAIPTTESLLGLVFEDQHGESFRLYDPTSTLPIPHITLLNGFVDLSTTDNQALATQAVKDAVHQALYAKDSLQEWALDVNDKSLNVFEHRESASLVCTPDKTGWLNRLYETLRVKFEACDEQEVRFADGWTPHLSLGKHSTTTAARTELNQLVSTGPWREGISLKAFGIGLFRRDMASRKFFPIATVPLVDRHNVTVNQTKPFLQSAGLPWGRSFERMSQVVLRELEGACQHATSSLWHGSVTSKVSLYGSHALGVGLPGLSDIDAVVRLQPSASAETNQVQNVGGSRFFQFVQSRLEDLHPTCKARLRVSTIAGGALYMLTIKLAPNLPSADLVLARMSQEEALDTTSQQALDSIADAHITLQRVQELGMKLEVFQGALRTVKLWANRRGIYGSSIGYLGGGGWAVLMVCLLEHNTQWNDLIDATDDAASAQRIASFFFCHVLEFWSNIRVVTLQGTNAAGWGDDQRDNMVVLAPKTGGNFGRSSTRSTTLQTWNELRRASQLLNGEASKSSPYSNLETCLLPHIVGGGVGGKILSLQVPIKSASMKPADVKARASILGLSATVALERILPADSIRPHSNIGRKNGSFHFLVEVASIDKSTDQALATFVHEQNGLLQEQSKLGNVASRLVELSPVEFQSLSISF